MAIQTLRVRDYGNDNDGDDGDDDHDDDDGDTIGAQIRLLGQERCCHQFEQVAREVHGGGLQRSLLFTCGKHNERHCSEPFEVQQEICGVKICKNPAETTQQQT